MEKVNTQKPKARKIGIVGLGPVGMILAVHLKEAGCDVVVCDVDKIKINLIRNEGVRLEETFNKTSFFNYVCGSVDEMKEYDLDIIIVSLKSYQVPSVLPALARLNNDKICFLSAQNGQDVEQMLSDAFGESKTLRMVVNFAGNLNAPNVVKVTFFNGPNYIASMDDSQNEVAKFIAETLNSVKLDTEHIHSFEIIKRIWEKNILNAALSPLCGIGKLTIKEAMDMPDTVELVEVIIQEALEVAEAEKIKFEDDFIRKCLRYLKKAGNHFPSLAVDLMNNRPTEIDYMNGKIVEYGRKHYIRTSLNLALTNMVKAMTWKSVKSSLPGTTARGKKAPHQIEMVKERKHVSTANGKDNFLGIDLGSAFIKFTVIDGDENILYNQILKTLNRDKVAIKHVMEAIYSEFSISNSCATGYGRKHFPDAEMIKTEVNCAAVGVSHFYPGAKNIIDIGGEDIKVIKCDDFDSVDSFYLNDKCAAGTGSFITEIAERADIKVSEMSDLASKSKYNSELNSFCTVFAKTEIMKWLFDGVSVEDIARGIYLSLANKVSRLRIDTSLPSFMIGGVIAHHAYLKNLLEEKLLQPIQILDNPQYIVSFGSALIAKQHYYVNQENKKKTQVITAN
jgi:2-dehydropantoate 2-reductase